MPDASYARTSFLGGIWSKYAQGRWDRPDYVTALNECLNAFPIEQGACVRRPGTKFVQTTRNGQPGRIIPFDFQQTTPHLIEFTAGFLRFRSGETLVTTNDDQVVVSISAANPAKVLTGGTHGWATGNSVQFANLGATSPLLQNRIFIITVTSSTEFTLVDSITGATIDGATLGAIGAAATVQRILEVASPYTGTLWQTVRLVQTEMQAVLLHAQIPPQVLTAITPTVGQTFYSFTLALANLLDGPYLDPPTNGTLITPSAVNGNITLTLTFQAYSAAISYSVGDFVSSAGVNYRSITDQNQGNTPAISPSNWTPASAGLAIGPNGFVGTDIGRLIRIQDSAAHWTWGKITGIANMIDRALAGSVNIGNMTANGGLAAAFDGITAQVAAASAAFAIASDPAKGYVGKNYSGASAQAIGSATLWPSSDGGPATATKTYTTTQTNYVGFHNGWIISSGPADTIYTTGTSVGAVTVNLRAKATAPANSADGTLLGSAAYAGLPVTITSNDQTTTWNYVWFEIVASSVDVSVPAPVDTRTPPPVTTGATAYTQTSVLNSFAVTVLAAEAQFFLPAGTGSGNAVTFQVLGPALADTTARAVWRMGTYSNTTGWPTCGTYHEGRLWLAGTIGNRLDGSMSNLPFNFAPTLQAGTVPDNSAITAIFNAPDVNTIFWLVPDHLGIIVGTLAGDWLVQASANNNILTPTSIQAHRYSKMGCANVEPRRADHTLLVVQRYRRKLLEYFPDVYSGKFGAQNITWAVSHLTQPRIAEIAYQQELAPIVWARCDDGTLFGVTYKRESNVSSQPPNFAGGHRHTLGSGRTVESICVGPSTDGTTDSLAMVTNDSTGIRHVEILTNLFQEAVPETEAWFLDDAVEPSSTSTSNVTPAPYGGLTLNGLWHLNAQTVSVFAGGLDCGDWLVTDGSATVTYGDGISGGTGGGLFTAEFAAAAVAAGTIVVGRTYTTDGQIVRPATPAETGTRTGPALGKKRRSQQFAVLLDTTGGISFGTEFDKLYPARFQEANGAAYATGRMFSGIYRDTLKDDYTADSMFCWRVTRPYSATVVAIEPYLQSTDS